MSVMFIFVRVLMFIVFIPFMVRKNPLFPCFNLFFFLGGSKIYRNTMHQCFIQFIEIIFCDIISTICGKMTFHDRGEWFYKYLKWLSIVCFVSFFPLSYILKKCHNTWGTICTWEHKFIVSSKFYYYIWHPKKRRPPRLRSNLYAFDFFIRDIENIRWKPLPSHRNNHWFCHNPCINIPIKKLIHEN